MTGTQDGANDGGSDPTPVAGTGLLGYQLAAVDTRVRGDRETPLTELVDGTEAPILDCRVHDRLTFQLPEDLPPGLYDIQVLVSNVGGDPTWGDVLFPDGIRASRLFCPLPDR